MIHQRQNGVSAEHRLLLRWHFALIVEKLDDIGDVDNRSGSTPLQGRVARTLSWTTPDSKPTVSAAETLGSSGHAAQAEEP